LSSAKVLGAVGATDAELLRFAGMFSGYEVWGGFRPCALVANRTAEEYERTTHLPGSVTVLRTALFFEARRERFVDFRMIEILERETDSDLKAWGLRDLPQRDR
jgi:hypothetical protein